MSEEPKEYPADSGTKIERDSSDKKYFVITPRLVWALCDSPYEYTYWCTIKDIAGEAGECYLTRDDQSILSMMSAGKVSQCRASLMEKKLLLGELRQDPGYPQPVWHLRIPDVWQINIEWCLAHPSIADRIDFKRLQKEPSPHDDIREPSSGDEGLSPHDEGLSLHDAKNIKKEAKIDRTNIHAGLDWKVAHGESVTAEDEETLFRLAVMDASNIIATGKPVLYDYAYNYMMATHTIPSEKQIKGWRKSMIDDWLGAKPKVPTPAQITLMVNEHIQNRLSFSGPHSFTYLIPKFTNGNGHTETVYDYDAIRQKVQEALK